ncbi:MAG: 16S rRNA processing protein RimM [Clostridia bacterium]|nr:16S rRNA processing protein RimM [Clostridia bacterium]
MIKSFLETGKITGTHGVRGEMRVHPWCDSPEFLTEFKRLYLDDKGEEYIKVVRSRAHGNMVILKADGIDTIEQAEKLRNKVLYISRKDAKLEEGAYFVQDLIDCKVIDADSDKEYGILSDVSQTGANDVWHIKTEKGEVLIPAIPDVVQDIDAEKGVITIRALKGLFDDEN